MTSIPPHLTAYQGMDVFFHAAEGYISTANCAASDVHAFAAIELTTRYLPIAIKDGGNLEARAAMAWASTQAGLAVTFSTSTGLHSLEHAISAYHPDIHHGAGLTAAAVPYFTYLAKRNVTRLSDIAEKMGEDVDALPEAEKPFAFVVALEKLIKSVGMEKTTLASLGVKKEEAPEIAQNSFDTMNVLYKRTPVPLDKQDAINIFEACF